MKLKLSIVFIMVAVSMCGASHGKVCRSSNGCDGHVNEDSRYLGVSMSLSFYKKTKNARLCTPDQWEGQSHAQKVYYLEGVGFVDKLLNISYDAEKKVQVFNIRETKLDGSSYDYTLLYLYNARKDKLTIYEAFHDTNQCFWAESSTVKFPRACMPGNTKSEGNHHLAILGKAGIQVTDYTYHTWSGQDALVTATHAEDGTIFPIHIHHHGGELHEFEERVFFNTTEGIKDRSVFDVPRMCKDHGTKTRYEDITKFSIFLTSLPR